MDTGYQTAVDLLSTIRRAGFTAYLAGGCVRDRMLGRTPKDYDIATDARPEQVEALFPKTVAIGKAFGVIAVIADGQQTEVTTFRAEAGYQDGRHPQSVHFCGAEEDARRRDFTINGMFYDPVDDRVIDYVDGLADLRQRILRAIGAPEQRFAEDHLRMLRAVRFAHTLGFSIEPQTRDAISRRATDLSRISMERIENEFSRILTEGIRPGDALRELVDLHLIEHMIPEILPMIGQEQPVQFHPEGDVFEHTVRMLNLMNEPSPDALQDTSPGFKKRLAYTLLLHDVGKPPTAFHAEDRIRFHGHERKGAEMAEAILRRLRLPIREIRQIVTAIDGHMRFKDVEEMNRSTLRKLIGSETFALEMELHRLDCLGSHQLLDKHQFLLGQMQTANEPALPERWIKGADLIRAGIPPGPEMGTLLQQAYDAQLEGRFEGKAQLLEWALAHYHAGR